MLQPRKKLIKEEVAAQANSVGQAQNGKAPRAEDTRGNEAENSLNLKRKREKMEVELEAYINKEIAWRKRIKRPRNV